MATAERYRGWPDRAPHLGPAGGCDAAGGRHRRADVAPVGRSAGPAPPQGQCPVGHVAGEHQPEGGGTAAPAPAALEQVQEDVRPQPARGVRAAGRADRQRGGPGVEGDGPLDQVRGGRGGGRGPVGPAARRLPVVPLAAQSAPLPRDGRRADGPGGEGSALGGVPRGGAGKDGHARWSRYFLDGLKNRTVSCSQSHVF